jgi:hypothetical protein
MVMCCAEKLSGLERRVRDGGGGDGGGALIRSFTSGTSLRVLATGCVGWRGMRPANSGIAGKNFSVKLYDVA